MQYNFLPTHDINSLIKVQLQYMWVLSNLIKMIKSLFCVLLLSDNPAHVTSGHTLENTRGKFPYQCYTETLHFL